MGEFGNIQYLSRLQIYLPFDTILFGGIYSIDLPTHTHTHEYDHTHTHIYIHCSIISIVKVSSTTLNKLLVFKMGYTYVWMGVHEAKNYASFYLKGIKFQILNFIHNLF